MARPRARLATRATPAAAQACCAGGALVSPVRLAPPEDYAVGLQTRVRSDSRFVPARRHLRLDLDRSSEQDVEQDLAASFRLARRAQVGFVLPYLETHRTASGVDEWGSGIGDWPSTPATTSSWRPRCSTGLASRFWRNVVFPTGKAVGDGTNPASTDATGTGTYNVSLGVDLEKVHGPLYGALNAWATYSGSSTVTPPPRDAPPAPLTTVVSVAADRAGGRRLRFRERGGRRALCQLPGTWRHHRQRHDRSPGAACG